MAFTAPVLKSVRHRRVAKLRDQDGLGSCTFFSLMNALLTAPLYRPGRAKLFTFEYGKAGYSRATQIDPFLGEFPPSDTGSSGLAACKVAAELGLITSYQHAFGGAQARAALVAQSVIQGTVWTEAMFYPDKDGRIHPTGSEVGGHQYCLYGLDVERRRTWIWNTWLEWGLDGKGLAYLTWDDHDNLLDRQGDVQVPVV